MAINSDKPDRWLADIRASVDLFNDWFSTYAPEAYRDVRERSRGDVLHALDLTGNLRQLIPDVLMQNPGILPVLRMTTAPPLAVDRLVGLAEVSKNLVKSLEDGSTPPRMSRANLQSGLNAIARILSRMVDRDLFPWLEDDEEPAERDRVRAASVVADRLTLSIANPVIRNAQEQRQLDVITAFLAPRGYRERRHPPDRPVETMEPGTYCFRMNVPGGPDGGVNIPVDCVIQPYRPRPSGLPVMIEAKSAGDYTNVNKRRKEESDKVRHLRLQHGDDVEYLLFLGGYFNRGYLEYVMKVGIDWVWEHRVEDFAQLGLDR